MANTFVQNGIMADFAAGSRKPKFRATGVLVMLAPLYMIGRIRGRVQYRIQNTGANHSGTAWRRRLLDFQVILKHLVAGGKLPCGVDMASPLLIQSAFDWTFKNWGTAALQGP